jgi:hypothetical protein
VLHLHRGRFMIVSMERQIRESVFLLPYSSFLGFERDFFLGQTIAKKVQESQRGVTVTQRIHMSRENQRHRFSKAAAGRGRIDNRDSRSDREQPVCL